MVENLPFKVSGCFVSGALPSGVSAASVFAESAYHVRRLDSLDIVHWLRAEPFNPKRAKPKFLNSMP